MVKPSSLYEWKNRGEETETVETSDLTPMYVLVGSSSHHKIIVVTAKGRVNDSLPNLLTFCSGSDLDVSW